LTFREAAAQVDAAGFVLAGGLSSRMGSDKALMQLGGRPLVAHALESLRRAGLRASIAGAASPLDGLAPVIRDEKPARGPLSGVCSALAACSSRLAVFVAVDAPFIPESLIRYLLRHAEVSGAAITIASVDGFAQTFPAVIDREVLRQLRSSLESERYGCYEAFQRASTDAGRDFSVVPVELLVQAGQVADEHGLPSSLWFGNLNTLEELRRAESLITTHRVI